MKKHIAGLLIFIFTLQIVTPSFAQSSQRSDLANLNACINAITKNGEVFKTETDLGENFNRLNVMKGIVSLFSDLREDLSNERSVIKSNYVGLSMFLSPIALLYATNKIDPYLSGKQNMLKAIRSMGGFFLVTFSLSCLIYMQAHSYKYFPNTNQNDQGVNSITIRNAVDEHDLNTQLSSDSNSARKFLSEAVKGCEQIRSSISYYEKNPAQFQKLIDQKKM